MYICYIDESGTPEIPGTSSHFILAGLAIPHFKWRTCDSEINRVKNRYGLDSKEIHTGWLLRQYSEQNSISNFKTLSWRDRTIQVEKERKKIIYNLRKTGDSAKLKQKEKDFKKTVDYIHLTFDERKQFLQDIAKLIGSWQFARLFAECIDKVFWNPLLAQQTIPEQAFEQLISRFHSFLERTKRADPDCFGILIHDNNQTVEKKLTELTIKFHKRGTLWTNINNIIETPFFVNSSLTSMIQISDVCAYALRRFLENNETTLFNEVFKRADQISGKAVGVRHYTERTCQCDICLKHC